MVCKTFSLDASKVINTAPRYAKLRGRTSEEVIGFQNIELISDRPYDDWLDDLRQLKKNYPTQDPDRLDHGGVPQGGVAADRRARSRRPASTASS